MAIRRIDMYLYVRTNRCLGKTEEKKNEKSTRRSDTTRARSPRSVPIRVWVRVWVERSQSRIFVFSHGGRRQRLYWYINTAVIHMFSNLENYS